MDLVGMTVQAQRDAQKFTLVTRNGGAWGPNETRRLLRLNKPINGHPGHPTALIIFDEHGRDTVAGALGHGDFTCEIVQGYTNPKLPFTPVI